MPLMDLATTIAALYASEINCGLQTMWDAGITVWIGDAINGRASQAEFAADQMDQVADWLGREARRLYPQSQYAQDWAGS